MNLKFYAVVILSISMGFAVAETTPAPIDYEARIKSVATIKEHIAEREERFALLKKDLLDMDARLEKQVDAIIKRLAAVTDSNDSRTTVARMKDDVMDGLIRNIWVYRQKRVTVFERMRKENIVPKDELEKTLKTFDDHINKRISQVMELAKSFPGHQDLKKYESYGTSYYDGYQQEDVRISEDWKQNRRDNISGRQARKEILTRLETAIETNQNRRATILNTLANSKISEKEKALQQEELGRTEATIDNLKSQRSELVLPNAEGGKEVGGGEAHDIKQMLDDARADLSRDFTDIMRKYNDLETERTRIYELKNNLQAREDWLKNNPPPNK
jgi:hypothetical protein